MRNNNWKIQSLPFDEEMQDALMQQHYAAQFVAKVGRYLIPQKVDDSNTNMEFIPEKDLLLGNAMPNGMRVALQLTELKLLIFDQLGSQKKVINLEGKTQKQAFAELSQKFVELGVDVTNFKNELHYEIPAHPLKEGAVFSVNNKKGFVENANLRHNAKIVLNEIGNLFEQEEPIRVWPHHFDTGAFYTISKNKNGEATKTIGIGLAIPDGMVGEPYYYLSFWSAVTVEGIEKMNSLSAGKWMMPDWNGAVLKHSELLRANSPDEQYSMVKTFFTSGIKQLKEILK